MQHGHPRSALREASISKCPVHLHLHLCGSEKRHALCERTCTSASLLISSSKYTHAQTLVRIMRPASSSLSVACSSCCRWWRSMDIYHVGFKCSRNKGQRRVVSVLTAPNGVHSAERGRLRGREVREEERETETENQQAINPA